MAGLGGGLDEAMHPWCADPPSLFKPATKHTNTHALHNNVVGGHGNGNPKKYPKKYIKYTMK